MKVIVIYQKSSNMPIRKMGVPQRIIFIERAGELKCHAREGVGVGYQVSYLLRGQVGRQVSCF